MVKSCMWFLLLAVVLPAWGTAQEVYRPIGWNGSNNRAVSSHAPQDVAPSPPQTVDDQSQTSAGQFEAQQDSGEPIPRTDDDFIWENETLPEWLEDIGVEEYSAEPPAQSVAQPAAMPPNPFGSHCDSIWARPTLTGDWHGRRNSMLQKGILYRGRVTQYFMGVSGGIQEPVPAPFGALGIEGGDTFEYTGNSQHDFIFDLEKLGGPRAGKFIFTLENLWGKFGNVSLETGASSPPIFPAFFPVDLDANGVPRVTNMLFIQPLSERLILTGGKTRMVGTADRNIFAGGDGSDQFINQTFIANPLFLGQLSLSSFTLGAIMPREWGNMSISVIDPKERSTDFFDLGDLFADGAMIFGQIKYNTNFWGKPGEHHVGGYYKHVDLLDLRFSPLPPGYPYPPAPPGLPSKSDSYSIFYGFDQYVSVYGKPNPRGESHGWGLFGRAGLSDGGDGNPNFSAWHASLGIGGDSPLCSRRDKGDRFGVAYGFTATANDWGPIPQNLFGPRDSQVAESYYRYQVTPAISITPDVQWIHGTLGGLTNGDDAWVYGLRMNIKL